MTTQDVINALHELGFKLTPILEYGYRFDYEGVAMAYEKSENDNTLVTFHVPCVLNITPENKVAAYEAMLKLTHKVKFVQPNIMFDDQVWLTYQHFFGDHEVEIETLEHMIRILAGAAVMFHNLINEDE